MKTRFLAIIAIVLLLIAIAMSALTPKQEAAPPTINTPTLLPHETHQYNRAIFQIADIIFDVAITGWEDMGTQIEIRMKTDGTRMLLAKENCILYYGEPIFSVPDAPTEPEGGQQA